MDGKLFENVRKIDLGIVSKPVKDWKERWSTTVKPGTFCIVETKMGPKVLYRNTMSQTIVTWPRKIDENRIVGVPNKSWIKEAVAEYFADPKAFMKKVNECEDIPAEVKDKPDIEAEDHAMEDYSDQDDPSKLEDKTKDNEELATREIKDKELEQKPTKESKVNENEKKPTDTFDDDGDTVYVLPDVNFSDDIAATVKDALTKGYESWLYTELSTKEGIANKDHSVIFWGADVQDHLPKHRRNESRRRSRGYRVRESLRFCGSCNKTFRSNESKCGCGNEKTELLGEREHSDMVQLDKPVFSVEYTQDGVKKTTRVTAFDEDEAKRYAEKIIRGAKATSAKKIGESKVNEDGSEPDNESKVKEDVSVTVVSTSDQPAEKVEGGLADGKKPGDFDPEQLQAGVKVEMEHTNDPETAREIAMDHLTEDPEYYTKLAKMEAGECDAVADESKTNEQFEDHMMPGQKPETPEEKKRREAMVSAAAKAVDTMAEDELEAYAAQIQKRKQKGK